MDRDTIEKFINIIDSLPGDLDGIETTEDGILIDCTIHEYWSYGGHEEHNYSYTIPWDIILKESAIVAFAEKEIQKKDDERKEAKKRYKEKQEREHKQREFNRYLQLKEEGYYDTRDDNN